VAEAVLYGPVSAGIFPANREKNREFGENRPHRSIQMSFVCVTSIACERIPYGMKQGFFFGRTENYLDRTGKQPE
jgi:hypothetical protein